MRGGGSSENFIYVNKITTHMEKQVSVGVMSDSMEELVALCHEKAGRIANAMSLNERETTEVTFWTRGVPELICVGKFVKGNDGKITYNLDFSQSTLL